MSKSSATIKIPCEECIYETLKLLCAGFGCVERSDIDKLLETMNETLDETPFIFFLSGDGVMVVNKEQLLETGRAMLNASKF